MAEHKIGAADTFLQDGQMVRLELEGQQVLVARAAGQYHAVGGNCSHYGGPLDEGILKGHTVMCPWHHACFDIRNGIRVEPPALNDLPHYPTRIDNGQVVVTMPQDNEVEPSGNADPAESRVFVIVGGGAAGNAAAEELRRSGFRGKIIMFSDVPEVPVDRPNLSKDYLNGHADPAWIPLRGDASWYASRDIDLQLKTRAVEVNAKAHTVTLENGTTQHYDKLLLATGGIPRQLGRTPGIDLEGVFTLRSLSDSDRIIAAASSGQRAVIVGASFIGLEVAASLAGGRNVQVTVVAPEPIPFAPIMGDDIGRMLWKEHEENGVQFRLGSEVTRFIGDHNRVTGVELKSGEVLAANFVVVGVGVRPATDFLADSGIALDDKDRAVRVDAYLRTSDPDVYAAGDIARWNDGSDRGSRIEHWRVAVQQGIVAARNMLGGNENVNQHVPFFWTNQWSVILDYVGHATVWDEIIYRGGEPAQKKFMAFFVHTGKVLAVAGCGYDKELVAVELILHERRALLASQVRDANFDIVAYAVGTS